MGYIVDGKIDPLLQDSEPGQMIIEDNDQYLKWEAAASGRALYARYGQKASEITDPKIWREYSKPLALGINELAAITTPQIIIIGGGVGAHYEKFSKYLDDELEKLSSAMVPKPRIIKAKRAEEAVVYGCYEYIKQKIRAAHKTAV
jgi:predicted NBD/HSP70 family sugar kinase